MLDPAPPWILLLCQSLAFWVALLGYRGPFRFRFLLGLGLGAILTRLGWLLLQAPAFLSPLSREVGGAAELGSPGTFALWLLQPGAGASVLFVPLGPMGLGLGLRRSGGVGAFWASSARALAPAIAMARFGCVLAGCCSGRLWPGGTPGPWPHSAGYPTALIEWAAWLGVSFLLFRIPREKVLGAFLLAFGGLRLVAEPLRESPPQGDPCLDPGWIALGWLFLGLVAVGRDAKVRPGRHPGRGFREVRSLPGP